MTIDTEETPVIDAGQDVASEPQETEAQGQESNQDPEPEAKDKNRVQKRISEIVTQRNAAEARAAEAEARAAELQAMIAAQNLDYAQPDIRDLVRQEARGLAEEQAYQAKVSTLTATLLESNLEGAVRLASGDQSIPFSQAMVEALAGVPEAPQVADYLAKNLTESWQISQMPKPVAAAAMAQIAAKFSASPVVASKAPDPVSGIKAAGGAAQGLSDNLPIDEWMKRHNALTKR